MITNKELNEVTLSPTKKDYYQIWNELMELADKISERWSPASTNESDPGIVLLKALTAVADKLNYNIDKNTLEAFMPSATQEDSMRKLTEMMGYTMKHYQSATGKATITYKSSNDTSIKEFTQGIYFPKFINLKNEDEDINYVTLEEFTMQPDQDSREVTVIEGELIECETNNDNIITAFHLDDLNRYILPEYTIAENGIFVTNISDSAESDLWRKEQNLNVQQPESKVYKFGFDSVTRLPYLQFPDDVKVLMEDGLKIKYIRTNGLSGNISAKVLSKMEKPAIWSTADIDEIKNLSADAFAVTNNSATTNGADPESLDAAYNNYKKTIGTFDTLVTCRDYMNAIYQMTESDTDTTPLVSNIIVSDIRDDINRTTPVCTFNEHGICYFDHSLKTSGETIFVQALDSEGNPMEAADGTPIGANYTPSEDKIKRFDLVFYPFKTIYGLNNKTEFKNSFKYSAENLEKIRADLALNKTIAHNIVSPDLTEVACIKNYLKLKARVTTTKKVTLIEETEILNNIYKAIYANFNARQVEFGEEIPYESLVEVIKNADYRIKEISLDEPVLNTVFSLADGATELSLKGSADTSDAAKPSHTIYNQLALRNVLAGKIAAFKYDTDFVSEYDKTSYPGYNLIYPADTKKIASITSSFDVGAAFENRDPEKKEDQEGLVLKENEVIQFRVPNFRTTKTYPAYVNYFIKLNSMSGQGAIAATFETLGSFLADKWDILAAVEEIYTKITGLTELVDGELESKIKSQEDFTSHEAKHGALFTKIDSAYKKATRYTADTIYYYIPFKPLEGQQSIFWTLNNWIKGQTGAHGQNLEGIYRTTGPQEKPFGRLIDDAQYKYLPAYNFGTLADDKAALNTFYVQVTHSVTDADVTSNKVTADGLGRDSDYQGVPKDGEYELKSGEYLLINYTDSKTTDGVETKSVINKAYSGDDKDPVIIRANFNLIDSKAYNTNHTYSKREGFSFPGRNIDGMFTLGTNEQIEIREMVKVDLNEESMYLYWTLNSDNPESFTNSFEFTENYGGGTCNAYTLKEGECLYYTNSKKQDLVYYGSGTLIVRNDSTLALDKYVNSGEVSEEEIMTNGLAAAIPWQHFDLKNGGLTIIENQYISLTEGDVLISIDGNDSLDAQNANIGNDWRSLGGGGVRGTAEYRFAEDAGSTTLPVMAVTGIDWSVRSRLDFNMSKTIAQTLNRGDKLTITYTNNPISEVLEAKKIEVDGKEKLIPVHVNSNYTCQTTLDTIKFDPDEVSFKLKVSTLDTPVVASSSLGLSLHNYVNGEAKYTKFSFDNLPANYQAGAQAFKLNISIADPTEEEPTSYGLMAIYYIGGGGEEAKLIAKDGETLIAGLAFFNQEEGAGSEKTLLPGLNIIKLSHEVKQLEIYPDENKKGTIIFGDLNLVTGINPKLDYRVTDGYTGNDAKLKQLLKDIKSLNLQDFYYNVPILNSQDIDLNPAIDSDTLSNPLAWYDPNNVNRKFVISEIDADYLSTGITISRTSRA